MMAMTSPTAAANANARRSAGSRAAHQQQHRAASSFHTTFHRSRLHRKLSPQAPTLRIVLLESSLRIIPSLVE
jgi:hypothetical protein